MSLFKQISILLSIVFTILFLLIVNISFNEIKDSAQKSLYQNIQNSVSNISLSITNANADVSAIKTVLNASFDNGNYEKIVFKDVDEKIIYERTKNEEISQNEIPSWFLNLVNIKEVSSSSTISQNWMVLGTLEIFADREVFYTQMYKIFSSLIVTLVVTFILFLVILALTLKSILKPLLMIKEQSDSILENKFIFQDKLPFTLEFKRVTLSINNMVEKIQNIFEHANEILRRNRELIYIDELTKLYNRNYLVLKTSEFLEENSVNHSGFVISIVLTRIDLLNKKIGYEKVDKLFIEISNIIKGLVFLEEANIIARTKASEFMIVLPRVKENEAEDIAKQLSTKLKNLLINIEDEDIKLYMALCSFKDEKNYSELLTKVDSALRQAKLSSQKDYYYLKSSEVYEVKKNFSKILDLAKENEQFNILYKDVISLDSKDIIYETVSFEIKTKDKTYSYNEFISHAIELNLLEEVYLKVIEKILNLNTSNKKLALEIPNNFIKNLPFEKLRKLFNEQYGLQNIIFEIEEESFVKYSSNSALFIDILKDYDFNIAVYNFMGISEDYNYLNMKKPEYIKVNKNFLKLSENFDALNIINKSLSVKLIVTSINDEEDLNIAKNKNVNFISGKITKHIV
ncbi:bifunctional diguanylate cyclase/phosphodiesterase [Halarcobacter anaerophilus]|uniref:Diguanylate cyclase n=1 Tax=Halarcobacter anaerophilus TaxID=877500 RepID=A0A4V1LPP4_9BACT|nr:LapD/MoxY N-terminal periplasmic domain-containing protein [Halarcobacter anaerophilus]QDF28725.1 diguanylate cyclase/phosphodiesterase (LapD/MoxY domain) [Halarcobacter anaerophilus]RXJ61908.1 diguanylate cyclase [Halarcobacter anaerophilus]